MDKEQALKDIESLQTSIEQATKTIEELKQYVSNSDKLMVEREHGEPEIGQKYFILGPAGDISVFTWVNDEIEREWLDRGLVFLTRKAAELKDRQRKVIRQMEVIAAKGDKLDWNNGGPDKWGLYFSHGRKEVEVDSTWYTQYSNLPHFYSEELAYEAKQIPDIECLWETV